MLFLQKYIFTWSFQTGAPNLDGILRLPGRLVYFPFFHLFGSVSTSYLYLLISYAVVFVSFFLFLKYFLKLSSNPLLIIICLSFTLSPAFLGNTAKVGLVAAAALLPLSVLLVSKFFDTNKLVYLIVLTLLLNYALIHPFTFTVNLMCVLGYAAYRLISSRSESKKYLKNILIGIVIAVGLNAYGLTTIIGVHSISKDTITQSTAGVETDYFSLVDIANTRDLLTAMSLSKSVLLDFNYYSDSTKLTFITSGLVLIALISYFFLRFKSSQEFELRRFVVFFGLGMICMLLSTGTLLFVGTVIHILINLPGGWMFRSPLKWQLYAPFFLWSSLAVLVVHFKQKRHVVPLMIVLTVTLVLQSGYIIRDVYRQLIVPKQIHTLQGIADINMNDKRLLVVTGQDCFKYANQRPDTMTELNEVLLSKNVQVKKADESLLSTLNIYSFDYIIVCSGNNISDVVRNNSFKYTKSYADGNLKMYTNTKSKPLYYTSNYAFTIPESSNVNADAYFIDRYLGVSPLLTTDSNISNGSLRQTFGNLQKTDIVDGQLVSMQNIASLQNGKLYNVGSNPAYYRINQDSIIISPKALPGYTLLPKTLDNLPDQSVLQKIKYTDSSFNYKNLVPNPSFNDGPWERNVGDCFRYDDTPNIGMKVEKDNQANRYITLFAKKHVACTHTPEIKVKAGSSYLLSLKAQADKKARSRYLVTFNDPARTVLNFNSSSKTQGWTSPSETFTTPKYATTATIYLESLPIQEGIEASTVRYDDISLINIPDVTNDFYVTSSTQDEFTSHHPDVKFSVVNPTRHSIHLTDARGKFYLVQSNSYFTSWALTTTNGKSAGLHMKLNDTNGWYIDVNDICKRDNQCSLNSDGTYNINLIAVFSPQKYFNVGLILSIITLCSCVSYYTYRHIMKRNGTRSATSRLKATSRVRHG